MLSYEATSRAGWLISGGWEQFEVVWRVHPWPGIWWEAIRVGLGPVHEW